MGWFILALLIAWLVMCLALVPLVLWLAQRVSAPRIPDVTRFLADVTRFFAYVNARGTRADAALRHV